MDEDLFDSETGDPAGGIDPNSMTDAQAVAAAGGTQQITGSGLAGYMQMLGMMPQQQAQAAQPQAQPAAMAAAAPVAGALPQGSMNPLLGLGITGQKAQQQPGMGAFGAAAMPINYAIPATPNLKPAMGMGGAGGAGSMLGGML